MRSRAAAKMAALGRVRAIRLPVRGALGVRVVLKIRVNVLERNLRQARGVTLVVHGVVL